MATRLHEQNLAGLRAELSELGVLREKRERLVKKLDSELAAGSAGATEDERAAGRERHKLRSIQMHLEAQAARLQEVLHYRQTMQIIHVRQKANRREAQSRAAQIERALASAAHETEKLGATKEKLLTLVDRRDCDLRDLRHDLARRRQSQQRQLRERQLQLEQAGEESACVQLMLESRREVADSSASLSTAHRHGQVLTLARGAAENLAMRLTPRDVATRRAMSRLYEAGILDGGMLADKHAQQATATARLRAESTARAASLATRRAELEALQRTLQATVRNASGLERLGARQDAKDVLHEHDEVSALLRHARHGVEQRGLACCRVATMLSSADSWGAHMHAHLLHLVPCAPP